MDSFIPPLAAMMGMGREYQNTPLGSLLAISCIPRGPGEPPAPYFQQPSSKPAHLHRDMFRDICQAQNNLNTVIHRIFYRLLKVCGYCFIIIITIIRIIIYNVVMISY